MLRNLSPHVIWLIGYSGARKSTIAKLLRDNLHARGRPSALQDGDAIRRGLSSDLGYLHADRTEHIRRLQEVARLLVG